MSTTTNHRLQAKKNNFQHLLIPKGSGCVRSKRFDSRLALRCVSLDLREGGFVNSLGLLLSATSCPNLSMRPMFSSLQHSSSVSLFKPHSSWLFLLPVSMIRSVAWPRGEVFVVVARKVTTKENKGRVVSHAKWGNRAELKKGQE